MFFFSFFSFRISARNGNNTNSVVIVTLVSIFMIIMIIIFFSFFVDKMNFKHAIHRNVYKQTINLFNLKNKKKNEKRKTTLTSEYYIFGNAVIFFPRKYTVF